MPAAAAGQGPRGGRRARNARTTQGLGPSAPAPGLVLPALRAAKPPPPPPRPRPQKPFRPCIAGWAVLCFFQSALRAVSMRKGIC